jgi:hypothetical protein
MDGSLQDLRMAGAVSFYIVSEVLCVERIYEVIESHVSGWSHSRSAPYHPP